MEADPLFYLTFYALVVMYRLNKRKLQGGRKQVQMRSFGRLLRRLRGTTSLEELARKTALEESYLAGVEAGKRVAEEVIVRHILRTGFALSVRDTTRLVLGIQLYELGLRDNEIRQLVVDLITREVTEAVRERVRLAYRSYS